MCQIHLDIPYLFLGVQVNMEHLAKCCIRTYRVSYRVLSTEMVLHNQSVSISQNLLAVCRNQKSQC